MRSTCSIRMCVLPGVQIQDEEDKDFTEHLGINVHPETGVWSENMDWTDKKITLSLPKYCEKVKQRYSLIGTIKSTVPISKDPSKPKTGPIKAIS